MKIFLCDFERLLIRNISACFYSIFYLIRFWNNHRKWKRTDIYTVLNSTLFFKIHTQWFIKWEKFLTRPASFIYKIFIHRTLPVVLVTNTWVFSVPTVVQITLASRLTTSRNWTTIANRDRYIEKKSIEMGIHTYFCKGH